MFQLRHLKFTNKECGFPDPSSSCKGTRTRLQKNTTLFSNIITNNSNFQFDHAEIQRIRLDFQTFIKNLHMVYRKRQRILEQFRFATKDMKSYIRSFHKKRKRTCGEESARDDTSSRSEDDHLSGIDSESDSDEEKMENQHKNGLLDIGKNLRKFKKMLLRDFPEPRPAEENSEPKPEARYATKEEIDKKNRFGKEWVDEIIRLGYVGPILNTPTDILQRARQTVLDKLAKEQGM